MFHYFCDGHGYLTEAGWYTKVNVRSPFYLVIYAPLGAALADNVATTIRTLVQQNQVDDNLFDTIKGLTTLAKR
jgi:hypothetical protein